MRGQPQTPGFLRGPRKQPSLVREPCTPLAWAGCVQALAGRAGVGPWPVPKRTSKKRPWWAPGLSLHGRCLAAWRVGRHAQSGRVLERQRFLKKNASNPCSACADSSFFHSKKVLPAQSQAKPRQAAQARKAPGSASAQVQEGARRKGQETPLPANVPGRGTAGGPCRPQSSAG